MKYILTSLTIAGSIYASAQVNESVSQGTEPGGVIVHADPRLDIILKRQKNTLSGSIRSGHGFRVQIYSGNDRVKAMQIKTDFMRRFPGVRTYLSYVQPQFRVKVGDYQTRTDAEVMFLQTSQLYYPCMIVPDIIMINTVKDD